METSDEYNNDVLNIGTGDENCSVNTEYRAENNYLLGDTSISFLTGNSTEANIHDESTHHEYCPPETNYFDTVRNLDEKEDTDNIGKDLPSRSSCTGFGGSLGEVINGKEQLSAFNHVDCRPIPSLSGRVNDVRTRGFMERESRFCEDSADATQKLELTGSGNFAKQSSVSEYPNTHNQTVKKTPDALLYSPEVDSNSETETSAKVKYVDASERIEEAVSEICDKNEDVTDSETNVLYEAEKEVDVMESSNSVKEEKYENLTANGRPKRKRRSRISYDESEALDSESLFDMTALNNGQTKHLKKKRTSKETNQRLRIIHSDSHFVEMFKNLYNLQKTGKYCDVKICGQGGHVLAHSVVLIAASPFLHKRYKQKMKTETDENHVRQLFFQNIPVWALEKIVTFLYTGILEVFEKDAKELSKHFKAVGLNEVHKKLCSKSCTTDIQTAKNVPSNKSGKVSKSCVKAEDTSVLTTDNDHVKRKASKRTLKTRKFVGSNAKISKASDDIDKDNVKEEDSVIVKVETSENTFKAIDDIDTTVGENAENEYSSNIENDIKDDNDFDDEWKAGYDESGDETDSYYENDAVVQKNKVKKKGQKKIKKKLIKKEKKIKTKHKNKEKTLVSKEKAVIETEEETFTGSEEEKIENRVAEDENDERVPLVIEAGNGGECDKCGKSFYFQYELTGHKNRCTGKNNRQRRKCVTCRQSFDSTAEYMDHRNNNERCIALRQEKLVIRKQKRFEMRRKFCCCVCSRKFRRLADQIEHEFLAHEIQYDKEKWPDLYCEFCNYWSMNPWKLHHHKLVSCNKGQEPICDMCGNSYKNEKTLKKHKELMHTDVQPMLTCEECGKTLKGKKGLKHHIRLRHRGENLHNLMMCHICSQTYRTSSDLTFHLYKVHEQPLPEGFTVYRCTKCDYCHNNRRFYEKHMFLHEDKREWHCEICSKAFKTKNSLNTHMIVHTSSRIPCPFDDCTYKALKNCHLKNHIENQHTQKGEKHEKCHLCEYATFFRGNLIKHQRSVHKLEVVTRHSVEMKAKYKNLKSGEIVGVDEKPVRTEKKVSRSRPAEVESHVPNIEIGSSRDLGYPASSSSDNSIVENQRQFQDKTVPMPPSQNVGDSFMYTLVNTPVMSHHSNFPTNANMYRIPHIDFAVYNQNSSMDQM